MSKNVFFFGRTASDFSLIEVFEDDDEDKGDDIADDVAEVDEGSCFTFPGLVAPKACSQTSANPPPAAVDLLSLLFSLGGFESLFSF